MRCVDSPNDDIVGSLTNSDDNIIYLTQDNDAAHKEDPSITGMDRQRNTSRITKDVRMQLNLMCFRNQIIT